MQNFTNLGGWNLSYSPFLLLLVLIWMVSCTQNKSVPSPETVQLVAKVNHYLDQSQLENLSKSKKLEYLNQAQKWAQKAGIDSLVLKNN